MDPVTGLIGAGLNLLDGLIYTEDERAKNSAAESTASATIAKAQSDIVIAQTQAEQTKMIALLAAGALLVGVIVWKVL
jgi:hypothetical protein